MGAGGTWVVRGEADGRRRAGTGGGGQWEKDVTGQACGQGHGCGYQKVMDRVVHGCKRSQEDWRARADAFSGVVVWSARAFRGPVVSCKVVDFRCHFVA